MKKNSTAKIQNDENAIAEDLPMPQGEKRGGERNLRSVFEEELKDIYGAERQLLRALPQMQEAAQFHGLKTAFADPLGQTKGHVKRLEQVFAMLSIDRHEKTCKAMEGL